MNTEKRRVYSINDSKYSANSIASLVLCLISIAIFLVLLFISFFMKGDAGAWAGAFGVTGIVMAVLGLRYGFLGFKDDCKSYFCCKFGTILSTAAIVVWFFVVCVGLVQMYF